MYKAASIFGFLLLMLFVVKAQKITLPMSTLDSLQGTWIQKEDSRIKIKFTENVMIIFYLNDSTGSDNKFYLTTYPLHDVSEIKPDMKNGHFLSVDIDSFDGSLLKYDIDYLSSSKLVLFFGHKGGGPFTYYKQKKL